MKVSKLISDVLTKRDKIVILTLVAVSILMALFETFRISIMMPFISVASNYDLIDKHAYIKWCYDFFSFSSPKQFVIILGIAVAIIYGIQTILSLLFLYAINRFSQNKYHTISHSFFNNYLKFKYERFTSTNSAIMQKHIVTDTGNLVNIISASMTFITQLITIICVYALLLWVNWKATLMLSVLFVIMPKADTVAAVMIERQETL